MNAFKQALVGTYSDSDTVIELNSISDTPGAPDYLVSGVPLILYDSLFGNPADSNNAGDYEIVLVTGVNYATNEITVTRAQENTTAQTISAGWSAVYGLTQAGLDGKVNVSSIVNDLTTGGTTVPLSAEQGKELQDSKVAKSDFDNADAEAEFADTDRFLKSASSVLKGFTWANLKTAILDFLGIETGTFDPEYQALSTNFESITYNSNREGYYFKIKSIAFIYGEVSTNSVTLGAGSGAVVATIPFVVKSIAAAGMLGVVNTVINFASNPPSALVARNGFSQILFRQSPTSTSGLQANDFTTGSSTRANRINFAVLIQIEE